MKIKVTEKLNDILSPELNSLYDEADNAATLFQGRAQIDYDYYYGLLPAPTNKNNSKARDRTCQHVVSGCLADLVTCFTSGSPVRFSATESTDYDAAKIATDMVNQFMLRDNKGMKAIESALKESLISGVGWIKRYWEVETSRQTAFKDGLTSEEELTEYLMGLKAAGLNIDDSDVEVITNEEDQTFSVSIKYDLPRKYVRIEHTPIEEIRFDQQSKSIDECVYFCHMTPVTKAQLLSMGYPKDKIDTVQDFLLDTSEGVNLSWTRNQYKQDMIMDNGIDSDSAGNRVKLKEHYFRTDKIENDGTLHLYKILQVNNDDPFDIEEVDEIPFTAFAPIPIPSAIIGESIVELVADLQELRAFYKRAALDNLINASTPKYWYMSNGVNRSDMLNLDKPGAAMEVQRPEAFGLIPQPPMPQGLDFLLQLSEQDAEARTGVSRTSQGLNPEVAARTGVESVSMIMGAAQSKIKAMCRTIANNGMRDLMMAVYDIFRTNSEVPVKVLTAKGVVSVDPRSLPARTHIEVDVALSPQEKQDRTAQLEKALAVIQQFPMFSSPEQQHYFVQAYLDSLNIKDSANFIMPLEEVQPPQPSQAEQLQAALVQAQVEFTQAQANKLINDAHVAADELTFKQQLAADEMNYKNLQLQFQQEQGADHTNIEVAKLNLQREVENAKAYATQERNDIHREQLTAQSIKDQSDILLKGRQVENEANYQE